MASTKEEPLHLKQGSKFFSKVLSHESSLAAPSFRVYYSVSSAGSVPFLWESQPGTPKNAASAAVPPPLTPPPSYYTASKNSTTGKASKKSSKHGILAAILPKISLRSPRSSSFSSCSSTSSSSSSSSSSFRSVQSPARSHWRAFSVGGDEAEAVATPCFRVRRERDRALRGCGMAMLVRSSLASVAGHGPNRGTSAA